MLGSSGKGCGWRFSAELQSSSLRSTGSVDMDAFKTSRNVWGAEEAFLSPPEYSGPLAASTESEGSCEDCEDYVCGLAEEIVQSMLQEQEAEAEQDSMKGSGIWDNMEALKSAWSSSHKMGSSPSSPQSILSGVGGYSQWDARSNKGSSGMSSPSTPQEESMEALYEELLRVKLEDKVNLANQQRMLALQQHQQIVQRALPQASAALRVPSSSSDNPQWSLHTSRSRRGVEHHVSPRENVLALAIDRAMMVKQGRQQAGSSKKGGASSQEVGGGRRQVGGAWGGGAPALAPQQGRRGSGQKKRREGEEQRRQMSSFASNEAGPMRAVFLGAPASRECGGTGVFLPRRLGSTHHQPHHSKGKPACSTVLLPSHIVQALNLNVEDTLRSPFHHRRDPASHHRFGHPIEVGNHRLEPKEEISSSYFPMSHSTTLQEVAPNISLPSEWTY